MRVRTARDDALLVELDDLDQAVALYESLQADPLPGVGVPVPGARTLLVPFRPSAVGAAELAAALRARPLVRRAAAEARTVEIPVRYDGEDLAEAAALLGWSPEELVRRHTAAAWTVGFVGFAPGFAYLTGDDPDLVVPRRSSPRTRVPAGSVALAGPYSGVYPRESPGGWQLVGRTDAPVWDVTRERPALLLPGDRVRFVAVDALPAPAEVRLENDLRDGDGARAVPEVVLDADRAGLEVVGAGSVLVEDLGRGGAEGAGVSASGALDRPSLRAANRAVGNPPGAAVLESVGGLRLRAHGPQVLAVTGAVGEIVAGGRTPRPGTPFALDDGEELRLAPPARGVRSYVAVRGGVAVPPVLGSRATDVLAGLGPDPLRPGDLLPVGAPGRGLPAVDPHAADGAARDLPAPGETVVLDIVLGPRDDWFDPATIDLLTGQEWTVTPRSNRIGLRLDGAPLLRRPDREGAELPSEGCVTGAIQVPPDGLPVLFLADHPLTGGYPVVGAVVADHVPLAGQLPPGCRLRFRVRPHAPATPRTTPGGHP
ncbi:carboxyltransferase domain-containing protein [Promicromonospora citrea]|uniref:Allophanate hydrolase n=2 Tax=Promicromonospora citrea TaxID=43677 RepID=A0A8H9GFR4_9MICO|nr:urea amidolyase family protein [Promicromonospora citrea]GGM19293.1 allophanate hydrolase [Promicromonospora citrea]